MPVELVAVRGGEGAVPRRLPTDRDGSLPLTTLQENFPGCCGLTFVHPETEATRGLRLKDGHLYPPSEGWGSHEYSCSFPKESAPAGQEDRPAGQRDATDLIVLGLPWKTSEQTVRDYFEAFGRVRKVWLKRDARGQSKGFAFVRFADYYTQMRVLTKKHAIDGRRCDVLIPHSKRGPPFKVFVGGRTEDVTAEDLRDYFYKYGEVTDVFVPKPFRPFGFVTFLDPEMAQSVCEENHVIKGVAVNVSIASPRHHQSRNYAPNGQPAERRDGPYSDRRNRCDFPPSETLDVDALNFRGLSLGGQDYVDRSRSADVSYGKFSNLDVNGQANRNIWGGFGDVPSVADDYGSNRPNGFSGGGVYADGNDNNYFPWLHPGGFQGPSSQWNQMQSSSHQRLS